MLTNKGRGRLDPLSQNLNWSSPSFFDAVTLCETWEQPWQNGIFKLILKKDFENLQLKMDTRGCVYKLECNEEDLKCIKEPRDKPSLSLRLLLEWTCAVDACIVPLSEIWWFHKSLACFAYRLYEMEVRKRKRKLLWAGNWYQHKRKKNTMLFGSLKGGIKGSQNFAFRSITSSVNI